MRDFAFVEGGGGLDGRIESLGLAGFGFLAFVDHCVDLVEPQFVGNGCIGGLVDASGKVEGLEEGSGVLDRA